MPAAGRLAAWSDNIGRKVRRTTTVVAGGRRRRGCRWPCSDIFGPGDEDYPVLGHRRQDAAAVAASGNLDGFRLLCRVGVGIVGALGALVGLRAGNLLAGPALGGGAGAAVGAQLGTALDDR